MQPISVVSPTAHNTSYYYRVIAVGQYSNSDPSDSVELRTTVGALAAPANVKINNATSSTVSPATVTNVTWEQVSNATNNHVTGYFIYSSNTATGTYTQIGEVSNNVFTFEVTAPLTVQTVYYKVAAKGYLANGAQSSYVSLVVSLTTADASQFSLTSSSVYAGDNLEITITTNTAASHKIKVAFFNETSGVIEMAAGAITHAYTIPMEWLNNLPDSTVGQASLTVETYDGDVLKGARSTTFNILVPLTVLPTIASFTGTRVDNGVPPAWGVYVVSKSQVLLEMGEASGAYGSTIVGFRLTGAGMNITSTMPITRTSPVLPSTSNLFTASVTDTRGRTNNYTLIINAFAYAPPTLGAETYRCDVNGVEAAEGTYGSAKLTTTFSPVDGKNAVTLKAEYRVKGSEEAWTNISGITNGVAVVFGGALDINNYYDVRYTVTDLLGTTVMFIDDISTAKFILHFKEGGDGLGIGGTSSDPRMVDVHWGMKVRENLDVDGTLKKSGTDVSLHGHRHSAEDIDGMVPGGSTYATFYVNDQMELVMVTEDNYTGVTFRLVEGRLEVVL